MSFSHHCYRRTCGTFGEQKIQAEFSFSRISQENIIMKALKLSLLSTLFHLKFFILFTICEHPLFVYRSIVNADSVILIYIVTTEPLHDQCWETHSHVETTAWCRHYYISVSSVLRQIFVGSINFYYDLILLAILVHFLSKYLENIKY